MGSHAAKFAYAINGIYVLDIWNKATPLHDSTQGADW